MLCCVRMLGLRTRLLGVVRCLGAPALRRARAFGACLLTRRSEALAPRGGRRWSEEEEGSIGRFRKPSIGKMIKIPYRAPHSDALQTSYREVRILYSFLSCLRTVFALLQKKHCFPSAADDWLAAATARAAVLLVDH